MTEDSFQEQLSKFTTLYHRKKDLEDKRDVVVAEMKEIEEDLLVTFDEADVTKIITNNGTVFIRQDVYVSSNMPQKLADYFAGIGLADMAKVKTVFPGLQNYVKGEDDRDTLDPALAELVKISRRTSLRVRR